MTAIKDTHGPHVSPGARNLEFCQEMSEEHIQ